MPLVLETKMADVGKLISLRNLLVRKVTWLVLTTTSATLILSRAFGADCMTRIAHIYSRLPRTHSLTFSLTESAHTLTLSIATYRDNTLSPFWLPAVNPTKMYTFCNLFLFCSAFFVRLAPASNTTTEISSNLERDKQPTWEKIRSSLDTLLYFYISIPYMKYFVHIHFIVYSTLSIFSLFP